MCVFAINLPIRRPINTSLNRTDIDVGYHTYGREDFILDEHDLPVAWKSTNTASWLATFYGEHILLVDFGEYGGADRLYPA